MNLPDLPSFEATWWPLQIETVPGSGERLTVAVVVRATNGQCAVRQAIDPPTLVRMFGDEGKGMQFVVGSTVQKIDAHFRAMQPVDSIDLPFGDMALGPPRDCVARDVNEVFGIALRLSSGFAQSSFGSTSLDAPLDREVQLAFEEWSDKIRQQILLMQEAPAMGNAFNVPVALTGRRKARFGFVHGNYVAQFGVLRPGSTVSTDLKALKVKLFDLDVVLREYPMLYQRAEILVGYQPPADNLPSRQREALLSSWEHLEYEARQRKITALHYQESNVAARHLVELAA